jgi:biotin-dependent carboxylase-like uncharacterized protein
MSIEILSVGFAATFEDLGRIGHRHFGVPQGGAFDQLSLVTANRRLGNRDDAPGIEITLLGMQLRALSACTVAVCGASAALSVNNREVDPSEKIRIEAGDCLTLGTADEGLRSYLCIQGGFKAKRALGSCSGTFIHKGDILEIDCLGGKPSPSHPLPFRFDDPIHIVPSPSIDAQDVALLATGKYVVSTQSNRTGLRLMGPALRMQSDRLSEPICQGAIQVTHSGQPIIIGPDGPTIGGYRTIAFVSSVDSSRVGQLRPDQPIHFELISRAQALQLNRDLAEPV